MKRGAPYRSELTAAYDALAARWSDTHGRNPLVLQEAADIFAGLVERGGTVLEIGCAVGRDAALLRSLGFRYLGVDLSPQMVAHARARVPAAAFEVGDLFDLRYPPNSFHAFWANAVLLHVPQVDVPRALHSIRSVLKPGGVGFVSMKLGVGEGMRADSTGCQRFFAHWQRTEFLRMVSDAGWLQLRVAEHPDSFGRADTKWLWCFLMAA